MSTYSSAGYTWNWKEMNVESYSTLKLAFHIRWNEIDNCMEFTTDMTTREDYPGWNVMCGYENTIESYKNYVAEQILLGLR